MPKFAKSKGDVSWTVPGRKRPIAYSTKAVSNLIAVYAEKYGGTIQELQARIFYNNEAKAILQAYIDRGYGNQIASEWFRYRG